jgi:hypothetical protein
MRPDLVVLAPELLDQYLRIDPVLEPPHLQALIAELAVEGIRKVSLAHFRRRWPPLVKLTVAAKNGDITTPEPERGRAERKCEKLLTLPGHDRGAAGIFLRSRRRIDILKQNDYVIDADPYDTKEQPDGILVASN